MNERFGHLDIWRRPKPGMEEHKVIEKVRAQVEEQKARDGGVSLCKLYAESQLRRETIRPISPRKEKEENDVEAMEVRPKMARLKAGDHCFLTTMDTIVTVLFADEAAASVVDEENGLILYVHTHELTGPLD